MVKHPSPRLTFLEEGCKGNNYVDKSARPTYF